QFADAVFLRANEAMMADMLADVLFRGNASGGSWKASFAKKCADSGGELARAVLTYNAVSRGGSVLDFAPPLPTTEPAPVKLAWIWAFANRGRTVPIMAANEILDLLRSLRGTFRYLGLYILAFH